MNRVPKVIILPLIVIAIIIIYIFWINIGNIWFGGLNLIKAWGTLTGEEYYCHSSGIEGFKHCHLGLRDGHLH